MMNDIPNNLYYEYKQKIGQSAYSSEIIQLIQEIEQHLLSSEDVASNLLIDAFQALQWLTRGSASNGEHIIIEYLLPYLERDSNTSDTISHTISRLRDHLVDWIDQYPEHERNILQERVLDQLLLRLRATPSLSLCWTISRIGFRHEPIVKTLWDIVQYNDNELGDTALTTLTSLGVPFSERTKLLAALHQRATHRMTLPLITAVRQLADPSSLAVVQTAWLQPKDQADKKRDQSLALRILTSIADTIDTEELQNRVWQIIVALLNQQPERFTFDIYLGSDIAPRCNSENVVPTLLEWLGQENEQSELAAHHRCVLSYRLEDCVRPRQLQGWKNLHIPSAITTLRQDACQDTRFEGRSNTHEMYTKKAAWNTLLHMGHTSALNWFEDAVSSETNLYLRQEICDLLACFRLHPLPTDVIQWVTEPYDANPPHSSAEIAMKLGAIELARSTASREAFEALLACGLSFKGQNLRASVNALGDVALSLARAGDKSVISELVDTIVHHPEDRRRTAAGSTLEVLAAEGLLPTQYIPQLLTALLEYEERDPFEQSMLVAALGHLKPDDFPTEISHHLQKWASDCHDWLGIQSFMALAKQDDLLPHEVLMTRLGLYREGERWYMSSDARHIEWEAHTVGLLYLRYPELLSPAIASLIETLNWSSAVQIIRLLHELHGGQDKVPLPLEIAEALIKRSQEGQTQFSAEPGIFQVMAQMIPERMAQEPWESVCNDWLPEARTALADALGEATYTVPNAKKKALALLLTLTGDGQYAVRRAAYRGLARQSSQSLQALCMMWSSSTSTVELRQRAAEAWAWLPMNERNSEIVAELYQSLASDVERSVRESINRTKQEKRKRLWAQKYLIHVRQVIGETNEEVLAAWPYAQALTRVGDDTSIQLLRTDLRTRSLPPHIRHWLQKIVKETSEGWEKATKKWPQPWRPWQGAIEEDQGWTMLPNGQKAAVHYALWQEQASLPSEKSSWGGTIQINDEKKFLNKDEIMLQLSDGRKGKALIKGWSTKGFITIVGQGTYPS